MGHRLLITLLVAALGAAAWWIARPATSPDEGLVAHVYVTDRAGRALENAQVQRTFAPGWEVVTRGGYKRLARVPLREGEAPSAGAIATAVQVRARYYALRRGWEPEVRRRADGAWEVRFALHHHGVLRLHVRDTHLGEAKAFPEPDEPLRRWEAMDAGNVARPGRPAAYRVYPGLEQVVVRLLGEPDMHGATGIATRRFFFDPPSAGHIVEKTVVPDAVVPIVGSVAAPEGPPPPTLGGEVRITELAMGGRRIEHDPVPVEPDGRFVVRTVGAGRYELEPSCTFLAPIEKRIVEAGDVVEFEAPGLRPWLEFHHRPLDVTAPHVLFFVTGTEDASTPSRPFPGNLDLLPDGAELTRVPLPKPGWCCYVVSTHGTSEERPLAKLSEVLEVTQVGPTAIRLDLQEAPHGTLLVRVEPEALERSGSATVRVGDGIREATLLPRIAQEARFENMPVGGGRAFLTWEDGEGLVEEESFSIEAGKTTTLSLPYRRGGHLRLHAANPEAATDARERVLYCPDRIGTAAFARRCVRHGAAPEWAAESPLPPGDYRAYLVVGPLPAWSGRPALRAVHEADVEFEIEPGETTVVEFEAR